MEIIIGLLIIAAGSFCQSSSYVPINKVKNWAWETYWLVQGVFAWVVFPLAGALLAMPEGCCICSVFSMEGAGAAMFYGALWGVGGLTFGLSMRFLGVALGQSVALGTCSAMGTLLPAIFAGEDLLHGEGLVLLIGIAIMLAGIAVIGYAGSLRSQTLSEEERRAAIKDFALTKGLLVALLAGLMSACFNLGLQAGSGISAAFAAQGASDLFVTLPATLLVTLGGALTNFAYCLVQNARNKTFGDYAKTDVWVNNLLFCALAGLLWYSQFFGLGMGSKFLASSPVMLAFAWSILMSLNVIFSNIWGVILKEWRGVSRKTVAVLVCGLAILIFSLVFPGLFN